MPFDLLPYLQAIKQAAPPSYLYNEHLARYQDASTGRIVAAKTIFKLLNSNETVTVAVLDNLSQALASQTLDLSAWMLAMQQQLSRLHVQAAALGAGGFERLKTHDFARITHALQADWPRLAVFGQEIVAGNLSRKQIASRVVMYAGHARTQYYAAKTKPHTKPGYVLLERRIIKAGDNCTWCVHLANLGWQPVDTLPLPGESGSDWQDGQCLTNCRCDLERKAFSRDEANALTGKAAPFFATDYSYRNIIKGGPGSGFHQHKGRPGQRGGSLPDSGESSPHKEPLGIPTDRALPVDEALSDYSYNHPLLEMYVGKRDRSMDEAHWLHAMSKQRKMEVSYRLQDAGLNEREANRFLRAWANTSNDHELRSLHIQQVASELFDAPLTEWQQANYDQVMEVRKLVIERSLEGFDTPNYDPVAVAGSYYNAVANANPSIAYLDEHNRIEAFVEEISQAPDRSVYTKAVLLERFAQIEQTSIEQTRKAVSFTYQETQKRLAAEGIKELHLFRGAALTRDDTFGMIVGDPHRVATNTLSSWSLSVGVADDFTEGEATFSTPHIGHRVVFDAIVPASRIYSMPITGPGCLNEWEVIVIGSPDDGVRVYRIDNDDVSTLFKGGPGSGYFATSGHRGRPGERGGSAPSGRLILPDEAGSATPSSFEANPSFIKHPLMKLFMGDKPSVSQSGTIEVDTDFHISQIKGNASDLAELLGVDEQVAAHFIYTWADTSNDSNLRALGVQEAASELFDLPLSDWQIEKLAEIKAKRKAFIEKEYQFGVEHFMTPTKSLANTVNSLEQSMHYPFEDQWESVDKLKKAIRNGLEIQSAEEAYAWMDRSAQDSKEKAKKALAYMYDKTQAAFKAAGITHVTAYRGTRLEAVDVNHLNVGDTFEHQINTLSSWTISQQVVDDIHTLNSRPYLSALGLKNIVPVSRIVSIPSTGLGSLPEWEIVVLGSHAPDTSEIYSIKKGKVRP